MLLTVLPVAIFAAFVISPTVDAVTVFVEDYQGYRGDFLKILSAFGITFDWQKMLLHLAFILVATVFLSYSYIAVYRHFRTGKLSIRSPLPYINSGFIPMLLSILVLYFFYVVFNFVVGCVVALVDAIVGYFDLSSAVFLVIVYLILIAQAFWYCFLLSLPLKVLPGMCIYGYSFIEAWNSTNRVLSMLGRNKHRSVRISVIVPFVVFVVLSVADTILLDMVVIKIVMYVLIISYYAVLSQILMFDVSQMERRDIVGYGER